MGNLASAVDELSAVDARETPAAQLHEEIEEILRARNRLDAEYLRRIEAVDRRGVPPEEHVTTQSWLRVAFRLSPNTAHGDVRLSRTLADVLPLTLAAMQDGAVALDHARLIASLRNVLTDSALAHVEQHLVAIARERNPHDLRRTVSYVKHAYAPERGVLDEQELYEERDLSLATTFRGTGVGKWTLPPAMQETLATAIHALSAPVAGDDRTAGQRRADALVTLAEMALRSGELPVTGGVKPHVSLILSADTAGCPLTPRPLRDEPYDDVDHLEAELHDRAVHLPFGAVISPTWARRFLCDAAVSRIVLGAASEVLDLGRATRSFTAAQTRAIVARDRHCVWPGCDVPAPWAEAHHRVHWADGGPTSVDNGVLLCGRHHDRVHLYGHAVVAKPTGRFTVDLRPGSDPRWQGPHSRAGP